MARIQPEQAVIGDGAVGLCAVISAELMGAGRIILMGRHAARADLGRESGAVDVVAERGEEGVATVKELTGGDGTHVVLEAVGLKPAGDRLLRRSRRRSGQPLGSSRRQHLLPFAPDSFGGRSLRGRCI